LKKREPAVPHLLRHAKARHATPGTVSHIRPHLCTTHASDFD
jgi:hypothetical protein